MSEREPIAELDEPYSAPDARPVSWTVARDALEKAEIYWLSTVRPDGRPHVTPVAAIYLDGSLFFSTGPHERKARNLERNTHCILATGCNTFTDTFDVIVEGDALRTTHITTLERLAGLFAVKYRDVFGFRVEGGAFTHGEGGVAHVFEVVPVKAFGYDRFEPGGATRYRF